MNLIEACVITSEQVLPMRERAPFTSRQFNRQPLPVRGDIFRGTISSMGTLADVTARGDSQCSDCACGLIY